MSKLVKGIGKVFKGIAKVFKKIVKSKIFKVILIAAAIYFTGGALGAWNTGFLSVDGAFTAAGSVASQNAAAAAAVEAGAAAGAAGATGATATGALGASAEAAGAAGVGSATLTPTTLGVAGSGTTGVAGVGSATLAPTTVGGGAAGLAGGGVPVVESAVSTLGAGATGADVAGFAAQQGITAAQAAATVPAAVPQAAGFLGKLGEGAKTIGSFIKNNELASIMALKTVAGAFSADEIDLMREQEEQDERLRQQRNQNILGVGGINLGFTPSGRSTLTTAGGGDVYGPGTTVPNYSASGLINRGT